MDNNSTLPPMPGSDQESLDRNRRDGFYDVKSRDFWSGNHITRIQDTPVQKCDHQFKPVPSGVQCTKCHFGLIGFLEIQNGKLFHQGEPIGI